MFRIFTRLNNCIAVIGSVFVFIAVVLESWKLAGFILYIDILFFVFWRFYVNNHFDSKVLQLNKYSARVDKGEDPELIWASYKLYDKAISDD